MSPSWSEVRNRAIAFSRQWAGVACERAEAKTFWDEFFAVFGLQRRTVAAFEEPVRNIQGQYGYIDLFWRGVLLVEHKSLGKDLGKAGSQAFNYIQDLARDGRTDEIPRYVVVSDFARLVLYDLEPDAPRAGSSGNPERVQAVTIPLADLHKHVHAFAFLRGETPVRLDPEDPANIRAAEIMGALHDALQAGGYSGHPLERLLVRVLFCLFADDTGIFEPLAFQTRIERHTREDGADLGAQLAQLFELLDTPVERRQKTLDEELAAFPYVNGGLFSERLSFAAFTRDMREALLACTRFNWSRISPAVFGSLFQSVMDRKERRQSGGHYTSERDILKVIRALFLDDLRAEFDAIRADRSNRRAARLMEFHRKLGGLRFLDPACGCGNFLVITYRELRLLEIEVLQALHAGEQVMDVRQLSRLDVDQMYGIEIGEWPARIAEVALWLTDHQMNGRLGEVFGRSFVRLPLRASPHIVCANALRLDWRTVLPPGQCSFILGNPPFVGAKFQEAAQRADMDQVAGDIENAGLLDYVTGWYFKAADYMRGTRILTGFVSTNSITQGEQAGTLWNPLMGRLGIRIHAAYRTFAWESEARGKAHVHVVIVVFGAGDALWKRIYEPIEGRAEVAAQTVRNISPYLVEGPNLAVVNRSKPLCDVPEIGIGNKPIDNGLYLFTPREKAAFLADEPEAAPFFRRWVGAEEFINAIERWCLWLGDTPVEQWRRLPAVRARVEAVRRYRLASKSAPTRKLADTPTRFHVENMPAARYLVIPSVSSEKRRYVPIGFLPPRVLTSNLCLIMPGATPFHFGVLTSAMHMAWLRQVGGRLESRYRYSARLVYNNFPWPRDVTPERRAQVESAARAVLDVRASFMASGYVPFAAGGSRVREAAADLDDADGYCYPPAIADAPAAEVREPKAGPPAATLADLYDVLAMPPALVKAHSLLDRAVDRCYRAAPFTTDRQRIEFLFVLYSNWNE